MTEVKEEVKKTEEKKVEHKPVNIVEGNTGTLTVRLLNEMNRMIGFWELGELCEL